MQPRLVTLLRVMTAVLIVGIVVMGGLFVRFLLDTDQTPRTEGERAVVAAEEAVRADPESADARIKLAAAYLQNGALSAADKQASIAVRLAPTDPSVYYIRGLVQLRRKDNAVAIKSLTKAVETKGQLAGFYQDAWASLASAYQADKQDKKALEAINKALNFGPENAQLLIQRAGVYEAQKKWADALYDYAMARNYAPDFEDAVNGYERIAKEHPDAVSQAQKKFDMKDLSGHSVEATKTK